MRDPSHDEDEIARTAADDLIGNVDVTAARVVRLRDGDQPRRWARGHDREPWCQGCGRVDGDRCDEPVAAAVRRLDVLRRLGIVLQRASDFANADLQRPVADVDVRPRELEQLILGHELTAARDEVLQHRERLGRERNDSVAAAELARGKVQAEGAKRAGRHAVRADYHRFE